jgi:hypothetical protein
MDNKRVEFLWPLWQSWLKRSPAEAILFGNCLCSFDFMFAWWMCIDASKAETGIFSHCSCDVWVVLSYVTGCYLTYQIFDTRILPPFINIRCFPTH